VAAGATVEDPEASAALLAGQKSYIPVINGVAGALAAAPACRARAESLLNELADIVRGAEASGKHFAQWAEQGTPATTVWRFQP
jgi:hypothetical protein